MCGLSTEELQRGLQFGIVRSSMALPVRSTNPHWQLPNSMSIEDIAMSKSNSSLQIGQEFGQLTVAGEPYMGPSGKYKFVMCTCSCGGTRVVGVDNLRAGRTRSCGCLYRKTVGKCNITHGKRGYPEYKVWMGMWRRCRNPNEKAFSKYEKFAPPESWKDFEVFYADLGPRPSRAHSLDRIDNSKPYGPGNCRWATATEQSRNRKNNIHVILGDRVVCLKEACDASGIAYKLVHGRFRKHGDMLRASNGMFKEITS